MTGIINTLSFFTLVLAIYYIFPQRLRWCLLLCASVFFYAAADWKMLFLLMGSIGFSYISGKKIRDSKTDREKKWWMVGSIAVMLLVLAGFKYYEFFGGAVNSLLKKINLGNESFVLQIAMPLGISYYTFKIISYLADIYKGKIEPEQHLGYYALYVSFFPQILCGPIVRAETFLPQLRNGCRYEENLAAEGLERMIIGVFKKLVIADRLAVYVNTVFAAPMEYPGLASVMAVFFYSIQIYCDFSGYSDMAVGMAKLLGIDTKENFSYPYFSRDIKEFWKRWHISLSGWLQDYVYIPLGGNRKGNVRKKVNLMITFFVSGIWHGNTMNFVIWGGLHGVWNMFSKPKKEDDPVWKQSLQIIVTFCGVTFTWLFFRAETLELAWQMLKHGIRDFGISVNQITASLLPFTGDNTCAAHFLLICFLILFLAVFEWKNSRGNKTSDRWIGVMLAVILLFGKFGSSSFLYGQF